MHRLPRRHFIGTLAASSLAAQSSRKPNVLVIMTDDQGYGDFSCHGNPVLKTPNMDKLHAESVRFVNHHSAPMCTPTRGQLMSGVDALRNRATSVTAGRAVLRRDLPTMANMFADGGYRTGLFGKWHLGDNYPYRPMDRGFEEAVYHLGWGFSSAPEFDNDYFNGRYHDKGVLKNFKGYCTDFWFDQAMAWMKDRRAKNEPFLCYLPTNTPHAPAWVAAKYSDPYKHDKLPANFFGMIANLDENLGRLDVFLRDSGLRDNTIVVFMTDNGATGGRDVFNAGMRGAKTTNYEGGHRVPCFIRWPDGKLRAPGDVNVPTQMQDILPTVLELTGVKASRNARFDGRSLAPLLRGSAGKIDDRTLVVQYGQTPKKWDACTIWDKWRLIGENELYDMQADPGQKENVATKNAQVLGKMRDYYEKWWDGVAAGVADFQPISIGSGKENPTILSSSDWQDVYCDNVGHVSNAVGGPRGAPWAVAVESAGNYEISLTRWPPWQKLGLTAGRPVQKMTEGTLQAGKALPIAGAKMTVSGREAAVKTQPNDLAAVMRVRLDKSAKTNLQAWFTDAGGNDIAGAFYATVRKV